ncbi:MAG TPA: hypothetical protein VJ965_09125 [Anaerolineales bacterium]|nr:hypothetical protein [Anaerolineales bacterium]
MTDQIEKLWADILSRNPERIQKTFTGLAAQEKIAVRAHLIKMTTESGWLPGQQESAAAALEVIKDIPDL